MSTEAATTHQGGCARCAQRGGEAFSAPMRFAFQPIWDLENDCIFAHEALLRDAEGGGPAALFAALTDDNRYSFDQRCRTGAIESATLLGIDAALSINFLPNAVYEPAQCIARTLAAAQRFGLPTRSLIFEMVETEAIPDAAHLRGIVEEYHARGFRVALDDFGAGWSSMNLLLDLSPDLVKLDRHMVAGLDLDPRRRAVVAGMARICAELDITLIAEGLERLDEIRAAQDVGISLVQGHVVQRPQLERLARPRDIRAALGAG